jgi:long-chain fatty acid transport protein
MNRTQPLALLIASLAGSAHAAGFALIEQNASGLGNAYAGAAAVAQDASTIYFNPAGMSLLPDNQLVAVGNLIKSSLEFSGSVSPAIVGGGEGGNAGGWALVPNLYYAHRLTPRFQIGIGVNAPFGLKTDYDNGWMGRYQAIKSEVKSINVNPSLAYKLTDTLSVGAGVSAQYFEATLTNDISPLAPGSHMKVNGDDYGWGYNLGLLWQPTNQTRIGLAYRSEVDHTLEGNLKANAVLPSGNIKADVTLPANASLSIFHKLSPSVDLLADITWTGWSSFDQLDIVYTSLPIDLPATPENWEDILRYSLGATWHMSDKLSLRGGVAYDEAVVSDKYRTPRLPDGARTWAAVGGQYRLSERGLLDFGYAHLFFDDPKLDNTAGGTTLTGSFEASIDIFSVQYTHNF